MENINQYAVMTAKTELEEYISESKPFDKTENYTSPNVEIPAGSLLKICKTGTLGKSYDTIVQLLDFTQKNPSRDKFYGCKQANFCKINQDLWPYIISIAEPERRLKFVQNQTSWRSVVFLKPNDIVSVSGDVSGQSAVCYYCIIRYIGPVQELYPVGYFFGLELLNLDSGFSPQSNDAPFSIKYMECDPSLSIFTTADRLSLLSNDVKKKFSALQFLTGTLEKVRTAISPNNCLSGTTETYPLNSRKIKKPSKQREATAKFYDTNDNPPHKHPENSEATLPEDSLDEMERLQRVVRVSDAKLSDSTNVDEDFKQSVENYEKTLERQHAPHKISNSQIPPVGILKHKHSAAGNGVLAGNANNADAAATKPLTIMSLEDRDIVVIDKADIHESTKNEGSIIVVDKQNQQDVDLVELLGNNWPNTAGDAAGILNQISSHHPQEAQQTAVASSCNSSNSSISSFPQPKINDLKKSAISQNSQGHRSTAPLQKRATPHGSQKIESNIRSSTSVLDFSKKCDNYQDSFHDGPLYDNLIDTDAPEADHLLQSPHKDVSVAGLDVGSMVEINWSEALHELYGVIRWIGIPLGVKNVMAGVELEDDQNDKQLPTTDGTYNAVSYFKCQEGRALFVPLDRCAKDKRFADIDGAASNKNIAIPQLNSKMFGQVECPSVPGAVAPLKIFNVDELQEICGKFKGIQGHHNSCYLDATLFSMFTFTSVFDSLLFRAPEPEDIPHYMEVQKVLREEIVNPLRKNVFVRADRVMKLRQLLDRLSSVSGLTSEEKDPEEFLNSLLAQIMHVEPFLKLSSGQDAYFYQLFVEKDERLSFPSVQQLFEQSFHSSEIKLKEVPSCLIIQMPRFGKNFKMYPRILPSQVLDVTDIIEDSPRQCSVCGKLAEYECRDCFGILQSGVGLESTAFCRKCLETVHMHAKRVNHVSKKLSVPQDFRMMAEHMTVPRLYMELFAVVCIETSHYVAFVKAGSGPDSPWCFFDSMADRKGEQNGYNIPEMRTVPDLPVWLSEEGARIVNENASTDKMLPEHAKRLFCDAYMCMYQSTDVMMYR